MFFCFYPFKGVVSSISIAIGLMVSPVTITICRRKSTRLLAVIGGLVLTLGCLFTSFAQQFHQVVFSYGKTKPINKNSTELMTVIFFFHNFFRNIFRIGIVVGLGVGITRDCSMVMIAQYFKKKREFVEVLAVSGSGLGIIIMSLFIKKAIDVLGWR